MKKILYVTDMGILGSGYKNLSVPLCEGLANAGHDVKVLGLEYRGEEHWFPFSIIPVKNFTDLYVMINNMWHLWQMDLLIVALDLPLQMGILEMRQELQNNFPYMDFKYWGIFPIEADPLSNTHAFEIMKMDKSFIISEFGTREAEKAGLNSQYLPVGIDSDAWKLPTEEERSSLRKAFAISDDVFVVLTVADNQERKNLSRTAQTLRKFRDEVSKNILWILVTRPKIKIGWNLSDLAAGQGLSDVYLEMERGISFQELWGLYAMADVFLLTSKAEGLGMPVLEAMSTGLPVVATNCTGMKESMDKGGGFPINPEKHSDDYIDPFGNQHRYFADVDSGVKQLENVFSARGTESQCLQARGYVETLRWENSVQQLLRNLEDV